MYKIIITSDSCLTSKLPKSKQIKPTESAIMSMNLRHTNHTGGERRILWLQVLAESLQFLISQSLFYHSYQCPILIPFGPVPFGFYA
eukprot:symbB.v1.2.024225.t1/scaffold2215.1/size85587/3